MKKFALWFFGILFGLIIVSNAIASTKKSDEPVPTPTPSPVVTPTPAAVPSPEPTVQPSPQPSPTPAATGVSRSEENQKYIQAAVEITDDTGKQMSQFSEIAEQPELVFTDDEVRIRLALIMARIKANNAKMQALVAPTEMKPVDKDLKTALSLYDQAMDILADGIDEQDTAKINRAALHITQGNDSIKAATAKILAFE